MENEIRKEYSDKDFESMGWHDCKIYSLTFSRENFEISIDLDYILKWVEPQIHHQSYEFMVAPVTLTFRMFMI